MQPARLCQLHLKYFDAVAHTVLYAPCCDTGMRNLLIEYRNNETAHKDIHFQFEEYSCIADSYYLAPDIQDDDPDGSIEKILVQLLEQWLEVLLHADSTHPVFLPYDFSDQFTRCLKCTVDVNVIEVQPGWSTREGHSVSPSNPRDYFYDIQDFRPETPAPIRLPQDDFFSRIKDSIAQAQRQLETS